MLKYFLILLILLPGSSYAGGDAPWCIISNENENCRFQTAEACYDSVAQNGGDCRENYRIAGVRGSMGWCVVTSTRRACVYASRSGCRAAAIRAGGGCVRNTELDLAVSGLQKRVDTGGGLADELGGAEVLGADSAGIDISGVD